MGREDERDPEPWGRPDEEDDEGQPGGGHLEAAAAVAAAEVAIRLLGLDEGDLA